MRRTWVGIAAVVGAGVLGWIPAAGPAGAAESESALGVQLVLPPQFLPNAPQEFDLKITGDGTDHPAACVGVGLDFGGALTINPKFPVQYWDAAAGKWATATASTSATSLALDSYPLDVPAGGVTARMRVTVSLTGHGPTMRIGADAHTSPPAGGAGGACGTPAMDQFGASATTAVGTVDIAYPNVSLTTPAGFPIPRGGSPVEFSASFDNTTKVDVPAVKPSASIYLYADSSPDAPAPTLVTTPAAPVHLAYFDGTWKPVTLIPPSGDSGSSLDGDLPITFDLKPGAHHVVKFRISFDGTLPAAAFKGLVFISDVRFGGAGQANFKITGAGAAASATPTAPVSTASQAPADPAPATTLPSNDTTPAASASQTTSGSSGAGLLPAGLALAVALGAGVLYLVLRKRGRV